MTRFFKKAARKSGRTESNSLRNRRLYNIMSRLTDSVRKVRLARQLVLLKESNKKTSLSKRIFSKSII